MKNVAAQKQKYLDQISKFYKAGTSLRIRCVENGFLVGIEPDYCLNNTVGGSMDNARERQIVCPDMQALLDLLYTELTYREELAAENALASAVQAGVKAARESEAQPSTLEVAD